MNYMSTTMLHVASLNCRSLLKINNPGARNDLIKHLRDHNIDILTVQESHAHSLITQQTLDTLFRSKSSIWSKHCGIICLNPTLELQPDFISHNQRVISCTVSHLQHHWDPFQLVTLYAPATFVARQQFFTECLDLPILFPSGSTYFDSLVSSLNDPPRRIITGDFNYSFEHVTFTHHNTQTADTLNSQSQWHQHLQAMYGNCFDPNSPTATFRRGQQMSKIDYFFASSELQQLITQSQVQFMSPSWTDHAFLSVTFKFTSTSTGKGLWRANPALASNAAFLDSMHKKINSVCAQFSPSLTPQVQWDRIKLVMF